MKNDEFKNKRFSLVKSEKFKGITVASHELKHLISYATELFVQKHIRVINKETAKAL